jgi:hypothetical protein
MRAGAVDGRWGKRGREGGYGALYRGRRGFGGRWEVVYNVGRCS